MQPMSAKWLPQNSLMKATSNDHMSIVGVLDDKIVATALTVGLSHK